MPTFLPTPAAAQGLELLAATAAASSSKDPSSAIPTHSLARSVHFNPAASLQAKLVRRILDLEFVEMSEISVDSDLPQASTRAPTPARLPVTDISIWVERFSLMAAILVTRFPGKAAELFAYQASIIQAERNYEGWCMTARSGKKPWHERTSNGRPRTPGYTTRPSRAAPRPSPVATTASRMTTSCPYAPGILTSHCLPGSQTCCHGQGQVSNRVIVPRPPGPPSAGDGTRAAAIPGLQIQARVPGVWRASHGTRMSTAML